MFILRKIYSFLIDTIQTLLLAASVFLVIYIFLFRPFQVSGESMFPNFENKEYVVTNLMVLRFKAPERGDVIVFKAPEDKDKDFIKRVIGLPGETVSLKSGSVYINQEKLNEIAYLNSEVKTFGGSFLGDEQSVTVPQEQFFVLGDNRGYSSDSREWGFVKKEEIIGESFFVYWPVSKARVIKNPFN